MAEDVKNSGPYQTGVYNENKDPFKVKVVKDTDGVEKAPLSTGDATKQQLGSGKTGGD